MCSAYAVACAKLYLIEDGDHDGGEFVVSLIVRLAETGSRAQDLHGGSQMGCFECRQRRGNRVMPLYGR